MEQDWRLNGQEEYLQNAVLYKVVFPDYWEQSVRENNAFYKMIEKGFVSYIKNEDGSFTRTEQKSMPIDEAALYWHEHCEFCWEKAMTNMACEFYCTKDFHYWICKECFEDFREQFGWTLGDTEERFT